MRIYWTRIGLGALLLEVVLFVVLVPISFVNTTAFLVAVPIGCFVLGCAVSAWVLRPIPSGFLLHGALLGLVATAMYFGLVFAQPGGLSSAVAVYGAPLFWLCQALRIAGCMTGAVQGRPRA